MKTYLNFLQHILDHGKSKEDRTGTGTISTFGYQMRFDLSEGFPLLTTKRVHLRSIIHELLWFVKGDTNIKYLVDHDVRIWNEWPYKRYTEDPAYAGESMAEFIEKIKTDAAFAKKYGDLGPVYGAQWRGFEGKHRTVDQLQEVITQIRMNPDSRRLIVNAWNPPMLPEMALPPCHMMFQFYVQENRLSLQMYQRSADAFLGVPFNIASYALLLMMVAKVTHLEVGELVHTVGDAHIYTNHLEQVQTQLAREPRSLPKMTITRETEDIEAFEFDDFILSDYNPHPTLKGKVAV